MDALEAIFTRRSVAKVSDERPSREEIARLLEAAVRAPTHHLTEPWRFVVLTGPVLEALGDVMAESVRQERAGSPDVEMRAELARARTLRAPVIVAVVYVPSTHLRALEVEDRYSVGAAIQNLLLAAHATGLAAHLRTGVAATDPAVHTFLELREGEDIAAFVYLGYPADAPSTPTRRTPAEDRTIWLGWCG
ncbi:MAG TPA: nitroreductase [Actinomycetota bacterium]|jgi:nitroreductase